MPSSNVNIPHLDIAKGVDTFSRPWMTEKWTQSMNMRMRQGQMSQVPLKVYQEPPFETLLPAGATGSPFTLMATLTSRSGVGSIIALSEEFGYQLCNNQTYMLGSDAQSPEDGSPGAIFKQDSIYRRWAGLVHNGRLLFTNPANQVQYTTGGWVQQFSPLPNPNTGLIAPVPAGWYLTEFYNHLVVGRPVISGASNDTWVAWSGLGDFSDWVNLTTASPESKSESDYYDFADDQSTDCPVVGVTGMFKQPGTGFFDDTLLVYLPNGIWAGRYTNITSGVMKFNNVVADIGNFFQYALARVDRAQYFIGRDNFYTFDGYSKCEQFGNEIKDYFFNDLSTNPDLRYRTWCYVDWNMQEIWWVYCSQASSGKFDSAVVFNYREKHWWAASVEDVHSFHPGLQTFKTIFGYQGTSIGQLGGQCNQLGNYGPNIPKLYGTGDQQILREETSSDANSVCVPTVRPVQFTTQDLTYGDLEHVKEINNLVLHASWPQGQSTGLYIETSRRNYLGGQVNFEPYVGELWQPSGVPVMGRAGKKIVARAFRFRFTPQGWNSLLSQNNQPALQAFTLRLEIPCQGGPVTYPYIKPLPPGYNPAQLCYTPLPFQDGQNQIVAQRLVGGGVGVLFALTVQVRGVVERKLYSGGTNPQPFVNIGGQPNADGFNVYYLMVVSPGSGATKIYNLNARSAGDNYSYCWALNYSLTLSVVAGSMLYLVAVCNDLFSLENEGANGQPIIIPAVPPAPAAFDGQFVQVDFLQSTLQTPQSTLNQLASPRGVVFSGWGESTNSSVENKDEK